MNGKFEVAVNNSMCSAGVKNGLRLVVNIEQYEYTKGPQNAVGLKLLLHQQDDVPLVQDFGDNVPAGMHTFVGVSVTKVCLMSLVLTVAH